MHFYGVSPEICLGYSRLKVWKQPDYEAWRTKHGIDPGSYLENIVYLHGRWILNLKD
jgi:hypothetical protein